MNFVNLYVQLLTVVIFAVIGVVSGRPLSLFPIKPGNSASLFALLVSCYMSAIVFDGFATCYRFDYASCRSSLLHSGGDERNILPSTPSPTQSRADPSQGHGQNEPTALVKVQDLSSEVPFPVPYFRSVLLGWTTACLILPLLTPRFVTVECYEIVGYHLFFLSGLTMLLFLIGRSLIRGEFRMLWAYKEDWGHKLEVVGTKTCDTYVKEYLEESGAAGNEKAENNV